MSAGTQIVGRWGDLVPRILSAVVMLGIGLGAIALGGWYFVALMVLVTGGMIWELARMTRGPGLDVSIPIAVLAMAGVLAFTMLGFVTGLILPLALGLLTPRRDVIGFGLYAPVLLLAGICLMMIMGQSGVTGMVWLIMVVVVSDVMGYFAGRILGGPKFWPAVSPKKTWSGTIAGWIGAALVGLGFWLSGWGGPGLIAISALVAFAGQMGDIAESAIKRRAGVKDASNLIPGHGGLMDRFDALVFAAIAVAALQLYFGFLPATPKG